jgi:hypothetical protein
MQIFETWQHEQLVPYHSHKTKQNKTKQNTLFIKATTTCQPMVPQQQIFQISETSTGSTMLDYRMTGLSVSS